MERRKFTREFKLDAVRLNPPQAPFGGFFGTISPSKRCHPSPNGGLNGRA